MTEQEEKELNAALEALDRKWQDTPTPTNDRSNVPDGKYQAKVERTSFVQSEQDGSFRFKWEFVIVVGEHKGRHLFRTAQLTPDGIGYLKSDLARAGVTVPETISGFKALTDSGALLDIIVELQAKTTTKAGKTYQNAYINGRVKGADVPAGNGHNEPDAGGESVPF